MGGYIFAASRPEIFTYQFYYTINFLKSQESNVNSLCKDKFASIMKSRRTCFRYTVFNLERVYSSSV
jgi:hypothetical protein